MSRGGEVFDWVVVGGGPHGVCASSALTAQGANVAVVEPSGLLMQRWQQRADSVAMTWMRSPVGHHLDASPSSLDHYLHRPENQDVASLTGKLRRPTAAAFLRHTNDLIARHELRSKVTSGTVEFIEKEGSTLLVLGRGVELRARRVLLATGSNQLRVPSWASVLRRDGAPIHHVFGGRDDSTSDVIGGGISAVQYALKMTRTVGEPVRIWMRRPVQEAEFDLDRALTKHRFVARWMGLDVDERFTFLERTRGRGSVPRGLASRLDRAVRNGSVELTIGIPAVEWDSTRDRLLLTCGGKTMESRGLTLATGIEPETLPAWLRGIADQFDLPTADGVPHLDEQMHWGRGIHVCGALARLRLGPMASQIVGARWAASRLPGTRLLPV